MTSLARWLPALWSLVCLALCGWLTTLGHRPAAVLFISLAALPLARDCYGRLDPIWVALPASLALLSVGRATGSGKLGPFDIGTAWAASVLLIGLARQTVARRLRRPQPDEPEDLLLLAVAGAAWLLLLRLWAFFMSHEMPWIVIIVWAVYAVLNARRRRSEVVRQWEPSADRHAVAVATRLERLGCWNGQASWTDPIGLLRYLLLPAWLPLWLATPRRMVRRWLIDDLFITWRGQDGYTGLADQAQFDRLLNDSMQGRGYIQPGDRLALLDAATDAAEAMADDYAVLIEIRLVQQAVALSCGRFVQAVAAGQRLASLAGACDATERGARLVQQAIGETALAFARLERPVEAEAWLARMGDDPVLDSFLRPIVTLLCEPAELRADEQWRRIANLPWAEQVPASGPMRRWQRMMHVEQLRQRLTAGYDPAAAAQGMAMGERPVRETPPDEVLVIARLQEAEGYPDMARATLEALLGVEDLPRNFVERARAELARLVEAAP